MITMMINHNDGDEKDDSKDFIYSIISLNITLQGHTYWNNVKHVFKPRVKAEVKNTFHL